MSSATDVLMRAGALPPIGIALLPLVIETGDSVLAD